MYYLVNYCKLNFNEAWNMPIEIRHWWIDKKQKEDEKSKNKTKQKQHVDPFGRHHEQ